MAVTSIIDIEEVTQQQCGAGQAPFSKARAFLAAEWCHERNCGWKPDDFSIGALVKVWWRCRKGHADFKMPIASRAFGNKGCPVCTQERKARHSGAPAGAPPPGATAPITASSASAAASAASGAAPAAPAASAAPSAAARAAAPSAAAAKANAEAKRPHAKRRTRISSAKRLNKKSTLAKQLPGLAFEWHYVLNAPLTPQDVPATSQKRVWWQCRKNSKHVWRAAIFVRAHGEGCPSCSKSHSRRGAA